MEKNSEEVDEDVFSVDRRSVLKGVGVAGLAGVGVSSATSNGSISETAGNSFDPIEATVDDVVSAITSGDTTATEIVDTYLERIGEYDETLNAFITVNESATSRAQELDKAFNESGPVGPLHGVPLVLKDNYNTSDLPTTGGSLTLEGFVPSEDAFTVNQLREAGAIVIGKGNMDEWAHGGSPGGGYSSLGGQTLNPYDLNRGPAGSSGGPAAAIAANLGIVSTGSDTGGSIRGPVAANALVGIKPTLGLTSRTGVIPFGLTLDVTGPMTHSVRDAATMLGVMSEVDTDDPKTYEIIEQAEGEDYTQYLDSDGLDGARLGIARDFFGGNDEVDESVNEAIDLMADNGAEIIDPITFPQELFDSVGDIYSTISDLEFKNYLNIYLSTYDDAPVETLEEVIEISDDPSFPINERVLERLIEAQSRGDFTNQFYQRTLETGPEMVKRALSAPLKDNDLDALIAPTSSCPPEPLPSADDIDYEIDYEVPDEIEYECENVPSRTILANISGYPEVSVPAAFTSDGLPTSVSFLGEAFDEPTLLKLAYAYEQQSMNRHPPEDFGALSG